MKTLVIVDVQHDFYHPSGSLYVSGGEEVLEPIKKLILEDKTINQIIFTLDWHTPEDKSFETWPPHCIQHSPGACLNQEILEAVWKRGFKSVDGKYEGAELNKEFLNMTYDTFLKGDRTEQEEYGAFENYYGKEGDCISFSSISEESVSYLIPNNDIIVCGLAGDYCVMETTENLLRLSESFGEITLFYPGIRSIDGGEKLKIWANKVGIKEYNYEL